MILHDWTHQPYFSLHINYQSYSYTRLIAEGIRRASLGGLWSTLRSQTLRQETIMHWGDFKSVTPSQCTSLLLNVLHSFSMYFTPSQCTSLLLNVRHSFSMYVTPSQCTSLLLNLASIQRIMYLRCPVLSTKLILKPLFISDQFSLNARCLYIVHANVSNHRLTSYS